MLHSPRGESFDQQVDAVLGHEFVHIRRRDLWVNEMQLLLTSIWWFHPFLWWLNQSLRSEREDCCDDELIG